ncbi:hypothetical protein Tdes44962_MAKER00222 [Teratosphaeria destructans]|uniref:Uncharacterized protein n=1 Tax=Teratosphaeria destructans TaxID=418781 RepID=A0A9W7W3X4_9PEZI|nr:hypothetical protein Tdes44962_MAKER00222 [Teratosphaeria destructans]
MDEHISASSTLAAYKYPLLATLYFTVTGAAFWRVRRQPYSTAIKWEQYETIFKGTTLGAAIAALAWNGGVNRRRSSSAER